MEVFLSRGLYGWLEYDWYTVMVDWIIVGHTVVKKKRKSSFRCEYSDVTDADAFPVVFGWEIAVWRWIKTEISIRFTVKVEHTICYPGTSLQKRHGSGSGGYWYRWRGS